ncbi:zinc finger protein 665 [Biomphalaria glabrata]|nr:zinc finger protein 665 [Biomphalaria glabrata]
MDAMEETVDVDEGSPDSADGDTTDTQTSQDPNGCKNRSKRKPSKTQIKHIAPKEENCDTSKYGAQNIDDLFNDVTQGLYRGAHLQLCSSQPLNSESLASSCASYNCSTPQATPKRNRRLSAGSAASIRASLSRPPPSYPCGICGKVFRVPSRYDSHMLGHSKGKPFCCNTCGKMFSTEDKLEHHLPVHNTDRKASFTCESCGKMCVNWRAYLYHLKAKHTESGGKRFSCNLCGRQFHTGQRLRNHMASHEIGKNHCCNICGKLFESKKKLDTHVMVHNLTSKHDQNLQCSDCGRQYSEWIAFKQHMKTHGAEGVQYPCGLCEKIFPTQYEKEKHKRVHKQVQCEFCERFFRSASVLSVHLRIHTGERPYKCGLCERDFSQASVLKVHMRTHRKEGKYDCKRCGKVFLEVMEFFKHHMGHLEEGNLQCEECGKMFESINNKNRHMAAHRDRAGRICHICGKEFGRVSHLEAHMICHSNQLPLLCKICGKVFPNEEALTTHFASHVGGESPGSTQLSGTKGPLFCGLCGKMFKGQVFLNNHMKRHERGGLDSRGRNQIPDEDVEEVDGGEFVCADCGKAFGKKHHLAVHRREHTGERPYTCILCAQSFTLRKSLLEHISEHKRNGLMMYTVNHEITNVASENSDNLKPAGSSFQDSDSGSDTETDHEGSDNIQTKPHTATSKYETRVYPSHSMPVQNNTFKDDSYLKQQTGTYQDKNFANISTNSYADKLYVDTPNLLYQEKHYQRTSHSGFPDKHYSISQANLFNENKNFMNNALGAMVSPGNAYNKKSFSQSPNTSLEEKQYLESSATVFSNKNLVESRKGFSDENSTLIKSQSTISNSDHLMQPYGITRNHYSMSPLTSNQISLNNSIHLHHTHMSSEAYSSPDMQISQSDRISSSLAMHRPDHHLASSVQLSPLHDYKHEMSGYAFPYNKTYMTANVNSLNSRNTFHGGFHRFHQDQQLSSFQLLPQTAFPENSHHA